MKQLLCKRPSQGKYRCIDCKKTMVRHKRFKYFWWECSGPKCSVTAQDIKGKPEFTTREQALELDFMNQLDFIKGMVKTLPAQILIRLIQKKGLSALSEKHRLLYYELVEPVRASIAFTKCCRCSFVLDAEQSLHLGENRYKCDWCWGH